MLRHGIRIEDIRWILLTHGHVDHLGGACAVWEKTGGRAKVVIPKKEAYLLRNRNAHIIDYKHFKENTSWMRKRRKSIQPSVNNDIGEDMEPTVEVVGGDCYLTWW